MFPTIKKFLIIDLYLCLRSLGKAFQQSQINSNPMIEIYQKKLIKMSFIIKLLVSSQ